MDWPEDTKILILRNDTNISAAQRQCLDLRKCVVGGEYTDPPKSLHAGVLPGSGMCSAHCSAPVKDSVLSILAPILQFPLLGTA